MVKLAFYKGQGHKLSESVTDTLIRWWTKGPYSHVEMIFSDNYWFSNSPRLKKTRLGPVEFSPEKWDFIELSLSDEQEKVVRAWAERQVGTSYDWLGIFFTQVLHWGISDDDKWFCSELIVAALQQVGYFPALKPADIHPNRLWKILKGFDDGTGAVQMLRYGGVW